MPYPGVYNFSVSQNETVTRTFTWSVSGTPVNVNGYTAAMKVRPNPASTGDPTISLTSDAGITLGGSAGTIVVTVAATAMDDVAAGVYVYDLVLTSGAGAKTPLLAGSFIVRAAVTL